MLLEEGALQAYREGKTIVSYKGIKYSRSSYLISHADYNEFMDHWTIGQNINERCWHKIIEIHPGLADNPVLKDFVLNHMKLQEIKE